MSARRKSPPAGVLAGILGALLLVALNPTAADFKAFYQRQAAAGVSGKAGGSGGLIGSIAKGAAGIAADSGYKRSNLLVASLYQSRSRDGKVQRAYLGVAKLFVKIK